MGRHKEFDENSIVSLRATGATTLKKFSDRRAIINLIVDNGGTMKVADINQHFGWDMTDKVRALIRAGWLEV